MKNFYPYVFILLFSLSLHAQDTKKLTLEDIFQNNTFRMNSVREFNWMNDGNYYTALVKNKKTSASDILKYTTTSGEVADTLVHGKRLIPPGKDGAIAIESYEFSADESKILITTESASIYRRSSAETYYILDRTTNKLTVLDHGNKLSNGTFSPDGSKVAFTRDNNLYYQNLNTGEVIPVTRDGKFNEIINGSSDWVYEEEFSLTKAFSWSFDGSMLAYLRFDESQVPIYHLQKWNGLYPEDYQYKYPKAGENNSVVSAHVYSLTDQKTVTVNTGEDKEQYLARIQWLPSNHTLSLIRINRLQNHLDILHYNSSDATISIAYSEDSQTYIDLVENDYLTYLSDGKSFILSSEKSGFKHLYHYTTEGKLITQLTSGNWPVTVFCGVDESAKRVYFMSAKISPTENHLYFCDLKGKRMEQLSSLPGTHTASFSNDFKFYMSTHSNVDSPPKTTLNQSSGKLIKVLAENETYHDLTKSYGFATTEFFKISLPEQVELNAFMMKPQDFDPSMKYPVLMFVYGGPGSQNVLNRWNSNMWHRYLTQHGYIVVCVDNRGTGGRGRDFEHSTYKNLGKVESADQTASAKIIAKYPYVDSTRIGIWGWSYGGYMSSLCLFTGSDIFKAAIAVAPVTNWKFYDSIYTERYLQKPQDNRQGYEDYSPVTHAAKLQGNFLLIHGTGDDNVHFQNAIELQNALIAANKQFLSFYYPDRDHGIYGGNTRLHLYEMMSNFIFEKL